MLDKFQEQDLMASVEILSALSKTLENEDVLYGEETKAKIEKVITSIKNINPTLFNYPREAKYTSGKYESTLDWDGEE